MKIAKKTKKSLSINSSSIKYKRCVDDEDLIENDTHISCGEKSTMILRNNTRSYELYANGDNENGQLGFISYEEDIGKLHKITIIDQSTHLEMKHIDKIACGGNHTLFLANNTLYGLGSNIYGQLGCALLPKGSLGSNDRRYTPIKVLLDGIMENTEISFDCGRNHSAVVMDKKLYTFGCGKNGRLGHGNPENQHYPTIVKGFDNVTSVKCGNDYTVFVNNNNVYVCGMNKMTEQYLLLVKNKTKRILKPIKIWKEGKHSGKNIKSIHCGADHIIISCDDIYVFGLNQYGQLGIHKRYDFVTFTKLDCDFVHTIHYDSNIITTCGEYFSIFVVDNKIWICGKIGDIIFDDVTNIAYDIFNNKKIDSMDSGDNHVMIHTNDDMFYAFGDNSFGQLGIDKSSNIRIILINIKKYLQSGIHKRANHN